KTLMSGRRMKHDRKATEIAISTIRVVRLSPVTVSAALTWGSVTSAIQKPPPAPDLDEVDGEEEREGDEQHHRRDRGRRRVFVLGRFEDEEERRDLRDMGDIAGDEDPRAVLADRPRQREGEAGEERGQDGRQDHPRHRL